jgi:hypothetical protein
VVIDREGSEELRDVISIGSQFITTVGEHILDGSSIFIKCDGPFTVSRDGSLGGMNSESEFNVPNFLRLFVIESGGMNAGEDMVKLCRFSPDEVIPILEAKGRAVCLGDDG